MKVKENKFYEIDENECDIQYVFKSGNSES